MQLIIFGATGMVGMQLVQQALFKGYKVKAFGRNVFTTDFPKDDNLTITQGALFDGDQVYKAMKGCDAVLSALGGGADGTDKTRSLGMKNIVEQMKRSGVKRIIALGSMGVLDAGEDGYLMDQPDYPPQNLAVDREHLKAFQYLQSSNLDWTFVCSPGIIHDGPTGQFITNSNYPPSPDKSYINEGDLALFMLNELEKNEYIKQRVGISN